MLLFIVFLVLYILNLVGSLGIIVVLWLEPSIHTPMYFFLSNLSFLDFCYTTSTIPQMLLNFCSAHKSITWAGCISQLYIFLLLAGTKCLLLALMAYEHYVANEAQAFAVSGLFLMVLLGLIPVSYSYIVTTVLRIRSAQGKLKAFNTCVSHLALVSLFYGAAISMYPQPPSSYLQDWGKMVSAFYGIIAPMLNSLIYMLRNKDVP
ncbi:olfactory receptor 2B2-like [Mauremys mutica]|uniref:olfactory receptor 2B2-like n=1 Tax=Mauremys mutica TaxID=74926 RepID=UPI001D15F79A|nr:olfactory receptor 2B2-like [Mauremys mutica]